MRKELRLLSASCCLVLLVGAACASNPEPFEAPPETRPPATEESAAPEVEEAAEPAATSDPYTVVIEEESAEASERRTLLEAARSERERRQTADAPQIVITDENLAEHATGELTVVGGNAGRGSQPRSASSAGSAGVSGSEGESEEAYWRNRVRAARLNWKTTTEEIEHLEQRVADLRRRFYEEDDPYYRDTQIKPSWDRALERLVEARDAVEGFRIRVQEILEEGRRAGALPGWLREGIDLEPATGRSGEPEAFEEHESREPSVVEVKEPGRR